jgi:ABC-2 type transport system permease protein
MTSIQASPVVRSQSPWPYIAKLVNLRRVLLVSGFRRASLGRKLLYVALLLLVALVFVGTYFLTTYVLGLVKSPEVVQSGISLASLVREIPGLLVSGAFLGILVCSFGVLLQALYLANDMDFLISAPLPIRAVFLSKLLQAVTPNFILISVFTLPVLFGLGISQGYPFPYYPLVVVLLIVLSLAAAGLASLLVMAAVRFVPAKRLAEILGSLAAILFIVLSQWANLTGVDSSSLTTGQISSGMQTLTRLNPSWFPLSWVGRGLVTLGERHYLPGIALLALTIGLCAGVFWLSLVAAERLYYSGWASMQVSIAHKNNRQPASRTFTSSGFTRTITRIMRMQLSSLLLKDLKLIRRDLRILSKVIMPMIMGIVFGAMFLRASHQPPTVTTGTSAAINDLIQSLYAYGNMFIPLFLGWMVALNLATVAFSMEGKQYWILKTAPLSAGKLVAAKFLVVYLPSLVLVWLYMLAITLLQGVPLATLLYAIPCAAVIMAGMAGLNLAFGVRYANLSWTDPRHMADGVGSYIAMILSFIYLVICLLVFITPPLALPFLGAPQALGLLGGLLACGILGIASLALSSRWLAPRVLHLAEE